MTVIGWVTMIVGWTVKNIFVKFGFILVNFKCYVVNKQKSGIIRTTWSFLKFLDEKSGQKIFILNSSDFMNETDR